MICCKCFVGLIQAFRIMNTLTGSGPEKAWSISNLCEFSPDIAKGLFRMQSNMYCLIFIILGWKIFLRAQIFCKKLLFNLKNIQTIYWKLHKLLHSRKGSSTFEPQNLHGKNSGTLKIICLNLAWCINDDPIVNYPLSLGYRSPYNLERVNQTFCNFCTGILYLPESLLWPNFLQEKICENI